MEACDWSAGVPTSAYWSIDKVIGALSLFAVIAFHKRRSCIMA